MVDASSILETQKPLCMDILQEVSGITWNGCPKCPEFSTHYNMQGRRVYFKVDDLDAFVFDKYNRVSSTEEINRKSANWILKNKQVASAINPLCIFVAKCYIFIILNFYAK